jgi:hypothetical protein
MPRTISLIEEFTRAGVRVEFIRNGARGDSPEDQLLVQFLAGAAYEIGEDEAALVAELFRRYADEGASIADLARWLTSQGVPTRTGKYRWDWSVIWAMLRNPAYAGTAVFGKTMAVHEPGGLNRVARLQARSVDLRQGREGLDFLGCHFHARMSGQVWEQKRIVRYYLHRWPSQRAMKRLRVKDRTGPAVTVSAGMSLT